ncbi:MAG: hypothetical protein GY797_37785 [Deltaproteobacteria bacterium]|nr:hypothetical protein [Deltaproteobacteria bacterium]
MRKRKIYSKKFKEEAIRFEEDGLTCIQVERDIGIGRGTVSKGIRDKYEALHCVHEMQGRTMLISNDVRYKGC